VGSSVIVNGGGRSDIRRRDVDGDDGDMLSPELDALLLLLLLLFVVGFDPPTTTFGARFLVCDGLVVAGFLAGVKWGDDPSDFVRSEGLCCCGAGDGGGVLPVEEARLPRGADAAGGAAAGGGLLLLVSPNNPNNLSVTGALRTVALFLTEGETGCFVATGADDDGLLGETGTTSGFFADDGELDRCNPANKSPPLSVVMSRFQYSPTKTDKL
jgi:hypothetical protein